MLLTWSLHVHEETRYWSSVSSENSLTDETWNMLYDSTWVQKAGLEEARSSRSRADTTGDGTYLPPAACLSRDRSLNNRVMNSH